MDPQTKTPIPNQNLAIAMLVCAVAILIATFSHSWVTWKEGGSESGGIGPMGAEFCGRGDRGCMSPSWSMLESKRVGMPGDISIWATLSVIGGLAAAGAAGLCGAMILTRKPEKVPVKPVRYAFSAAAGVMALFAMRLLTATIKINLGLSWGTVLGLGGVIAAAAIFQTKLAPWLSTLAPAQATALPGGGPFQLPVGQMPGQQMQPPPAMQAAPPCPRCQRPLVFVAQYQRWFCEGCKDYV
jgi:hypothetical protein